MAKEKILIVDDENTTRAIVADGLKKAGYQVFEAQSGESGYQIARSVRPHLVISDVVMDQMGGHQLIKKLRDSEFGKGMLFIVLTAHGQMQDYFEMMKVDDFIAKPFDMEDVLARVEKVLSKLNKD
jgi:phosphoserine phosphatase RsbU/P